jgi:glutamate---cysteine ligase / carboxylate-amine ligase
LTAAGPAPRFGAGPPFAMGMEDELLVVDPRTHALAHDAVELIERVEAPPEEGEVKPDTYAAMVELASPRSATAGQAVAALAVLRGRLRAAGATLIGAGIHPAGAFGDVVHYPAERYALLAEQLRGLLRRTPTAALHVHVGMPDAEAAIRACNGLREHLPLLQALAANSPFWYGRDSGLATVRAPLFHAFRGAELPRAFASYEDYAEAAAAAVHVGALPDYTFLWWDVRPHPALGTVEVRAMDSQAALWSAAALGALVHALARREAERRGPWAGTEALREASFAAARDGLGARLPLDGALRPVPEVARATLALARPHADDPDALALVARILATGNGADRQRAAFARGGMPAVLAMLAEETAAPP